MNNIILKLKKTIYQILNMRYLPFYFSNRIHSKIHPSSVVFVMQDMERMGSEVLALYILKELNRKNIPVTIISYKIGAMIKDFSKCGRIKIGGPNSLKHYLKRLSSEYKCNKAICNTVITGEMTEQLHKCGFSVVSLIHEMKSVIIKNHLETTCDHIVANSNCVIFPSNYVYKDFCECISFKSEFPYRIKNQGVFLTESLVSDHLSKEIINKKYSIPNDAKIIINVATANMRKGIDLFLDIAKETLSKDKNIYFIWIGDGAKSFLDKKCNEHGKQSFCNVRITGYIKDPVLLNRFYHAAELFLLTSREEPFGSVVLEAFKAGTPVVAFNGCGGYMDVVKENETGCLIEPFNIVEATTKILRLINDANNLNRLSNNCKKEADQHNFSDYCDFIVSQFDKE